MCGAIPVFLRFIYFSGSQTTFSVPPDNPKHVPVNKEKFLDVFVSLSRLRKIDPLSPFRAKSDRTF